MTDDNGHHPEPAEHGRYSVFQLADGGLLIARTAGICERCEACGCGEKREPIGPVPGAILKMMESMRNGSGKLPNPAEMMKMIGALRRG